MLELIMDVRKNIATVRETVMPIKIKQDLAATQVLENENIFVMTEKRAITQDIRPLKVLELNLMPDKQTT